MINLNTTPGAALTLKLGDTCVLDSVEFVVAQEDNDGVVLTTTDSRAREYNELIKKAFEDPDRAYLLKLEMFDFAIGNIQLQDMVQEPLYHNYIKHVRIQVPGGTSKAHFPRGTLHLALLSKLYYIG